MSATETHQTPSSPSLPASPWPALWALVIGFFMILVDTTIVSVATPAIMDGLDADVGAAVWVTSAYLLAYAVPLLITGRLGDRFGPKRLYLIGLAVFTLASAACGFATDISMLITARAVQGFGAALMTPQTMAVITRTFPPERRGAAMGLWGSVAGVATLIGPLAGGVLLDTLGWEWIFFVNIPVGLIGFVAAVRLVPSLEKHVHRFDWLGVALSAVGIFCLVFGLEEAEKYDWGTIAGPISVWGLIITGLVVMVAFVAWQHFNTGEPLVPLALFKDRNFTAANIAIFAMGFITLSMSFPIMLYAQSARGLSPTQSALLMLPMAVISGGLAPWIGSLLNKRDPRPFAVTAFVLLAIGLLLYGVWMRPEYSVLWLLIPGAFLGLANAGIWGPLSVSATRNLPMHRAGAGSGVYNTTRQIGAVIGSASIATFMQFRLSAHLPGPMPAGGGFGQRIPEFIVGPFSAAMGEAIWLPAAVALIGVVGASLLVWRPAEHGGAAR